LFFCGFGDKLIISASGIASAAKSFYIKGRKVKSITKFNVPNEQIKAAFRAAGIGEISDIAEISDGWYNSVFSASDRAGKKYVIKIAPKKEVKVLTHEKSLMAAEVNFYRVINQQTSIRTPKIICSDFSEEIIPAPYFIMDFLAGERLDKANLTPEEREQADRQWAWIFAELHKIKGAGFGYEQVGLTDNWKDALKRMTKILIADAASFGKKCPIGTKLLKYIEMFSDELKGVPSVLVNFDLHALNLFCEKTEEGIRLAVFDLERAFWGDKIGDFVLPEMLTAFPKKRILALYNRYADTPITVGRNELVRYNLMLAYLAAIMYTERFSRFKGITKLFNRIYLAGTAGYIFSAKVSFSALKKLSRVPKK